MKHTLCGRDFLLIVISANQFRIQYLPHPFPLNQSHQLRNPQRQRRNIGHRQEKQEQHGKVGKQGFCHRLDTDFTDAAAHEEHGAYRRGHIAHAHVEDQHNAELDAGHAQAFCDRQEDGGEDQDCRSDVHEHAYNQQDHIHQQEDDDLVGGNAHDGGTDGCRNPGVGHNKGHGR